MDFLMVLGGLVLLFVGGEGLVRGAVALARRLKVSPLFTGIVIVGMGTSAPELVVCLEAALRGQDDIVFGNVVGSNVANLMLILAIAALIHPVASRGAVLRRDGTMMLLSSVVLVALAAGGDVGRLPALALLAVLLGFIGYCFLGERGNDGGGDGVEAAFVAEAEELARRSPRLPVALLLCAVGLAVLLLGAELLVEGATSIARAAGLSEAVIAITLVAVGTSLPELATVVVAALRKHGEVALGNVLGSNIFNVFGILGLTALVEPVRVGAQFLAQDVWVLLGISVLLFVFLRTGWRLDRWESAVLLLGYATYVGVLLGGPQPGAA